MPDIFVNNNFYISTSSACIIETTPPTFAGINFLDVESRGQIRAGWPVATDATAPIRYEVYIQAATATGLFSVSNIIALTPNLQYDIFTLPDGSFLINGTTYFVGVRAIDGVSNRDSNTVSISVISTGVLTSIDQYAANGVFVINEVGNFQGTFWGIKNSELANTPDAILGTGSYQVYDRTGAVVVGMTQSGIVADANGQYIITAIPSILNENLTHYIVKLVITIDGETRTSNINLETSLPKYEINGVSYLNNMNTVTGSFWVSNNEQIVTTNLGTATYQAYSSDGTLIPGLSESGIVADPSGIFPITPFILPGFIDPTAAYSILVTITVNNESRSDFIVIDSIPSIYGTRGQFSINALNQLEATFWATKGNERADPTILGTASYIVYDKAGIAVGISESGLTADVNGLYHTTAVSAAVLTDLTHYTVKLTIEVGGADRINFKGFTLLGT